MDWNGKFVRGMFSEVDGTPSTSRVLTAIITAFALGWVTAIIIFHMHAKTEPILPDLGGLAAFIGTLYGVNKITGAFSSKNGGGQ